LGDIYADQGKLEDAIQWYELLVELAPTNVHYNAKLQNLRAMRAAQVAPPPPVPEPEAKPAKPKTLAYALFGVLALILIGASFVAGARMSAMRQAAAEPVKPAQGYASRRLRRATRRAFRCHLLPSRLQSLTRPPLRRPQALQA
jgi:hypothetical protein